MTESDMEVVRKIGGGTGGKWGNKTTQFNIGICIKKIKYEVLEKPQRCLGCVSKGHIYER